MQHNVHYYTHHTQHSLMMTITDITVITRWVLGLSYQTFIKHDTKLHYSPSTVSLSIDSFVTSAAESHSVQLSLSSPAPAAWPTVLRFQQLCNIYPQTCWTIGAHEKSGNMFNKSIQRAQTPPRLLHCRSPCVN